MRKFVNIIGNYTIFCVVWLWFLNSHHTIIIVKLNPYAIFKVRDLKATRCRLHFTSLLDLPHTAVKIYDKLKCVLRTQYTIHCMLNQPRDTLCGSNNKSMTMQLNMVRGSRWNNHTEMQFLNTIILTGIYLLQKPKKNTQKAVLLLIQNPQEKMWNTDIK